jgi:hypothetical protein
LEFIVVAFNLLHFRYPCEVFDPVYLSIFQHGIEEADSDNLKTSDNCNVGKGLKAKKITQNTNSSHNNSCKGKKHQWEVECKSYQRMLLRKPYLK